MDKPSTARARVFFALWPAAAVRSSLAAASRAAQAECGGRATPEEKLHMTLFFVGQIERARLAALKALGSSIAAPAIDISLNAIGYWRQSGIVWVGSHICPEPLAALVNELQQGLSVHGIAPEARRYVPHVTLVRDALRPPRRLSQALFDWRSEDFVLVESVPSREGVRYDVISRWRLAGFADLPPGESS